MATKLSPKSPIRAPGTMPTMVKARSIPTSVRQMPITIIVAIEIANSRRNGSRIMQPMHRKSEKVNVKAKYKGNSKSLNIRLPSTLILGEIRDTLVLSLCQLSAAHRIFLFQLSVPRCIRSLSVFLRMRGS